MRYEKCCRSFVVREISSSGGTCTVGLCWADLCCQQFDESLYEDEVYDNARRLYYKTANTLTGEYEQDVADYMEDLSRNPLSPRGPPPLPKYKPKVRLSTVLLIFLISLSLFVCFCFFLFLLCLFRYCLVSSLPTSLISFYCAPGYDP